MSTAVVAKAPRSGADAAGSATAVPSPSSFTCPSVVTRTFDGRTWPWTSPRRCTAQSAPVSWMASSSARSIGIAPAANHLVEALPRQQFANDVGLAVLLTPVVDGADVGVRDQRGDVRLPAEAIHRLLRRVGPAAQHLDRHGALQSESRARHVSMGPSCPMSSSSW